MKSRIVHVTIALLGLFGLGSCNKNIDLNPLSEFSNEAFWISEENTLMALTAMYRAGMVMPLNGGAEFSPSDWWSYNGLLFLEFATDNAYDRRGDNAANNRMTNGTLVSDNAALLQYWTASYRKIAMANFFLENVDRAPLSEEVSARFKAEARFIRACQYFYLAQFWGSVPLVTTTLTPAQANTVTKAAKSAIVDFVITELQESAAALPLHAALPAAQRGRVTRQAAWAFLGRMLLAERRFGEAAAVYSNIIQAGENRIDPNYSSLFNGTNESSSELIFATQYLQGMASNGMLQHIYPATLGGWHLHCPLGSMMEAYQFVDGTAFSYNDPRYNAQNLGANRDPRLNMSILYNGNTLNGRRYVTHPDSTLSPDQLTTSRQATRTGFGLRKFAVENFTGNLQDGGVDVPVIRYAEVLLSYLEARLENGDAIDQTLLNSTINAVRGRSSVNMPPVQETDPAALRAILRNERRVELAFEGIRYWDLLRWGTIGQVLNGDFYGAPYPGATNVRRKPGTAVRDTYSRWFVTSKAFRVGQDELWPVPLSEVNINPNLR
ncbi:RagB/SusD family nutrient uptake outer membrane protein [Sphingobacterium griseoflavum]|uniref:Glycan metabolism protein RagB n=1 Tax=Sphingobacterium griseoflavum TaxID=1474952 RepID=A0ABQ3HTB1_9SPHI|nr:RagB/SusD family nutrient uptake outer membrane protein [Sphingobacterium griseoflavum]GHE32803.1 glycan metabolism protein RagB [Sphingobacterium griseoflavum]